MDSNLQERLAILETAGEISERTVAAVEYFVGLLEAKYAIQFTEENGAMLVTHLAMALARVEKGEDIEGMSPELLAEVQGSRYYAELAPLLRKLEEHSKLEIPEAEQGYLALHLTTGLEKVKGGGDN